MKKAVRRHHNKMFRKIITYFLILAVVLPVLASAVPLPSVGNVDGVNRAQAADATKFTGSKGQVYDPCNFDDGFAANVAKVGADILAQGTGGLAGKAAGVAVGGGNVGECISYSIVNFLYDWVLWTAIQIAGLAGNLFKADFKGPLTGVKTE